MFRTFLAAALAILVTGPAAAITLAVDFSDVRGTPSGADATASAASNAFAGVAGWDLVDLGFVPSFSGTLSENGAASRTVDLSITGNGSFFTAAASGRAFDPLRNDYLVANNRDNPATVLEFSLSGLDAGQDYRLYLFASDADFPGRQTEVRVDADGDGTIDPLVRMLVSGDTQPPQNVQNPQSPTPFTDVYVPLITADALGTIRWQLSAVGDPSLETEINLAGFNLARAPVPLPAAGWMLLAGLGALGLAARRRHGAEG